MCCFGWVWMLAPGLWNRVMCGGVHMLVCSRKYLISSLPPSFPFHTYFSLDDGRCQATFGPVPVHPKRG